MTCLVRVASAPGQVIADIVTRYDVDGVHFDDYFYPVRTSSRPAFHSLIALIFASPSLRTSLLCFLPFASDPVGCGCIHSACVARPVLRMNADGCSTPRAGSGSRTTRRMRPTCKVRQLFLSFLHGALSFAGVVAVFGPPSRHSGARSRVSSWFAPFSGLTASSTLRSLWSVLTSRPIVHRAGGGTLQIADWRRQNVNQLVQRCYDTVHKVCVVCCVC